MRLNIVVFCLVLSLPVLLNATSVFSTEFKTELKKSSFGKSIIGLEQLAAKLGSKGIYDQLYQAIDDLIAKLQSQLQNENDIFADQELNHNSLVNSLQVQIDQFTETLNSQSVVLENAQAQVESLTSLINSLNDQIQNDYDQLNTISNARVDEQQQNSQRMSDLNAAINAAQQAIYMLQGLQNEQPSLIQTSAKMQATTENLKQSLKKVTKQMFFKVLIQALEEQNYANQEVLQQIINLLNDLLNSFQTELTNLQTYEANAQADFQTAVDNLNADIASAQDSLQILGQQLDDANASIDSATSLINDATSNLESLNGQLNSENANFASATQSHNDLNDEIQKEIQIAQQAESFLQQNLTEVSLP